MKLATTLCACLLAMSTAGNAYGQHGDMGGMDDDHHGHCDPDAAYEPLLSVADVDGSGRVNFWDVVIVAHHAHHHDYVALYDRDANLVLDARDVAWTIFDWGAHSSAFDQELVGVYRASRRYADVDNAIADGFRPFTQELAGHGFHYARMPFLVTAEGTLDPDYENHLDEAVDIYTPEGLNYDQDGNLVAVFYYHGINVLDWVFANQSGNGAWVQSLVQQSLGMSLPPAEMPHAFSSDHEMWHNHWGACWDNLDYPRMSFDIYHTPVFSQPLTQLECATMAAQSQGTTTPKLGWLPAFNMMHLWVHKLNRCGVFAGTDPEVSPAAPPEPFVQSFEVWMAKLMSGQ